MLLIVKRLNRILQQLILLTGNDYYLRAERAQRLDGHCQRDLRGKSEIIDTHNMATLLKQCRDIG